MTKSIKIMIILFFISCLLTTAIAAPPTKYNEVSARVQHLNDAGVVDSERIVQFGEVDAQGLYTNSSVLDVLNMEG